MITARLPKYKSLDPKSVGIALLGLGSTPFSYDPRDGSITMTVRDAMNTLKGKYQRALIWATDAKSGKRVEASLVFKLPEPPPPAPPAFAPVDPDALPKLPESTPAIQPLTPAPQAPTPVTSLPAGAATAASIPATALPHGGPRR